VSGPREFLFSLERFGMKFGLANMARLCDALGHPERAFASVLVAGTNGKGSVTAMVETALRAAGHRSARYTSPHLVRLEERFVIDGREVDADALDASIARLESRIDTLIRDRTLEAPPTFFECTTAVAFDLFREAAIEIAVLEVGLGGRLDATNIVTPVAGAIVSIDFDHQAQLGSSLASIAAEKAGIVKPGVPLVCGAVPDEALQVIERVCREQNAPLIRADRDVHVSSPGSTGEEEIRSIQTGRFSLEDVHVSLRGAHQLENARVAVALLDALDARGIDVDDAAVRSGLTQTIWPGRLEEIDYEGCRVLLDAAHNPAGARALASYLQHTAPAGVTLVFGVMQDKDVGEMLSALRNVARDIICTTASTPRAMPAAIIGDLARAVHRSVTVEPDPIAALMRACRNGGTVVVAGSIFLIGPIREMLTRA
jgi:dihydrofolate synthase / folylpolyglutamate synthase